MALLNVIHLKTLIESPRDCFYVEFFMAIFMAVIT